MRNPERPFFSLSFISTVNFILGPLLVGLSSSWRSLPFMESLVGPILCEPNVSSRRIPVSSSLIRIGVFPGCSFADSCPPIRSIFGVLGHSASEDGLLMTSPLLGARGFTSFDGGLFSASRDSFNISSIRSHSDFDR